MYSLQVFHAHSSAATEVHQASTATEVLKLIPDLLSRHTDCDRVVVFLGPTRLFGVDCKGNRLQE